MRKRPVRERSPCQRVLSDNSKYYDVQNAPDLPWCRHQRGDGGNIPPRYMRARILSYNRQVTASTRHENEQHLSSEHRRAYLPMVLSVWTTSMYTATLFTCYSSGKRNAGYTTEMSTLNLEKQDSQCRGFRSNRSTSNRILPNCAERLISYQTKDEYSGNWYKDSNKFQESMTSGIKAKHAGIFYARRINALDIGLQLFQICANTDRLLFKQLRVGCTRANAFCLLSFVGRNLPVMTEDGLLPNLMNNPRFHSLASR